MSESSQINRILSEQLRIGTGIDFHTLYEGFPLTLAGIVIPFEKGFRVKRSDGDPISHAIVDAMLAALGEGDIADWFNDEDGITNAQSIHYLGELKEKLLTPKNVTILNLQVLILAEKPKLKPFFQQMQEQIATQLGIDMHRVSIQGKTFEGKGIIGQQQGIEVHTTVSILKNTQQMVDNGNYVDWAKEQATSLLPSLGNRWLHVQSVVDQARWVSQIFNTSDQECLVAAAYLHDIGYAPSLQQIGFHPIDGARYVRENKQERLACLVAYHSGAEYEATFRGLNTELSQFTREHSLLADALDYCDMTTGPTGKRITMEERLAEIFSRFDETTLVNQAMHQAAPFLKISIKRVENVLRQHKLIS